MTYLMTRIALFVTVSMAIWPAQHALAEIVAGNDLRPAYWNALKGGQIEQAKELSIQIDAGAAHGDLFKAFTDAHIAIKAEDCDTAYKLAQAIIGFHPNFYPAYDVAGNCAYKDGDIAGAQSIFQSIADRLPEGPLQKSYQLKADALRRDQAWSAHFEFHVDQSDNLNRRTSVSQTQSGWTISEDSKAQDGLSGKVTGRFSKKLGRSDKSYIEGIVKTGLSFDSLSNIYLPSLGSSLQKTWLLDENKHFYVSVGYDHSWVNNATYRHDFEITSGFVQKLDESTSYAILGEISKLDFTENDRDSIELKTSLSVNRHMDARNILTGNLSYQGNNANNAYYNLEHYSAYVDWEHLFPNGFITSLKGEIGFTQYDRTAALTSAARRDEFSQLSFGLSHHKIQWKGLRPQLTYSVMRNISNDVFHDYRANDFSLVVKKSF